MCFQAAQLQFDTASGATIADGLGFFPLTVSGEVVFGQFNTTNSVGIGSYDTQAATFTRIATYPATSSGVEGMSADGTWVAWTEGDSATDQGMWTMWAWNTHTKHLTKVGSSRSSDGSIAVGAIPTPLVSNGSLIWNQPTATAANPFLSELRALDLEHGTVRVLNTGQLSPPIRAGQLILWGAVAESAGGKSYELRAASVATLEPASVPAGLQQSTPFGALTGTSNQVGIGTANLQKYSVYSVNGQQTGGLQLPGAESPTPNATYQFQFVQLAEHHIIWNSPTGVILANLDTGVAVRFPEYASAFFVGSSLFVSYPRSLPTSKGTGWTSKVTLMDWPIADAEHC